MFIIAVHNQYGGFEQGGLVIHSDLVYFLGVAFALRAWLLGAGLQEIAPYWSCSSRGVAMVWLVLAPALFVVPTAGMALTSAFWGSSSWYGRG